MASIDTTPAAPAALRSRRRIGIHEIVLGLCLAVLGLAAVAAIAAPLIAPYAPQAQSLLMRLQPPAFTGGPAGHLLGTDELGRDLFSRTLYGIRTTLAIATIGVVIGMIAGSLLGLAAGLLGGRTDAFVMMLVDTQLALPFLLIALTALTVFGNSGPVLVAVIGFAGWETYARVMRGQVLAIRAQDYIAASAALGASSTWIALRHVLPNVVSPITVLATLNFSSVILLESSLSFLGLGVQPPTASLGSMVGFGRDYLMSHPWIAVVPALVIVALTVATSFVGDWLRDRFDARLR